MSSESRPDTARVAPDRKRVIHVAPGQPEGGQGPLVLVLQATPIDRPPAGPCRIGSVAWSGTEGGTMARRSLRSQLYRAARDLGNVEAAQKGPGAYGRRVVRRKVYRQTNGTLGKLLKGIFKG